MGTMRKWVGRRVKQARNTVSAMGKQAEVRWRSGCAAPTASALEWLRRNELPSGGIRAFSGSSKAYPEVTV